MKALKIVGIIIGSFVGVFALIFYAYPYINKEIFQEMKQDGVSENYLESAWIAGGEVTGEELENILNELEKLKSENSALESAVDSLMLLNEDLRLEISEWENMEDFMPVAQSPTDVVQQGSTMYMDDEEFGDRVKSLLNLDEDELAPIVNEMDDGQLIRLYRAGGTIQREKLLRSLSPRRAAKLMSEVML